MNSENINAVALTFENYSVNDANNINFLIWTYDVLISNTYSAKNKHKIGTVSVQFPTRSERAVKRELNKNEKLLIYKILELVTNSKNETTDPIKLSAKFCGDNDFKDHECTIKITDTPNLVDKLVERGLITD